jgi:hypothetical protein
MKRNRLIVAVTTLGLPLLAATTAAAHPGHGGPAVHVHAPAGVDQVVAVCTLFVAVATLLAHASYGLARALIR